MVKNIVILENNIISTLTVRSKLTRVLIDKGFNVTILTTGTELQLQKAKDDGFNVIDVKSGTQNPFDIFRYMFNIRKAIKKCKADVCLTFTIRPAIWGNLMTRQLGIPTITNITGVGPLFESKKPAYKFARLLYKISLKKTAKIFFQNKDDRELFLKNNFVVENVSSLIPGSGVDHDHFFPDNNIRPKDKFIFLFIGRLLKDKGIVEYIEAARLIKKEYPDIEFRVIGPLWQQNLKENTITEPQLRSWIDEAVINYYGEVLDVREHIASATCIVLPSYREGTSNVLLEASSMERPCITTNTTGCKEIVEEGVTGFLCNVSDSYDLYVKMKKMFLLSEDNIVEMGKNAREKVKREFDKKIVIDAYIKAIETTATNS